MFVFVGPFVFIDRICCLLFVVVVRVCVDYCSRLCLWVHLCLFVGRICCLFVVRVCVGCCSRLCLLFVFAVCVFSLCLA